MRQYLKKKYVLGVLAFSNIITSATLLLMEILSQNQIADEQALVSQAKNDEYAFTQLYNLYFTKIYNFINKRVSHQETAEDLVSETFMKVFANLDKYKPQNVPFGAWLFRIASNSIIDYYRKEYKHPKVNIDDLPNLASPMQSDDQAMINDIQKETQRFLNTLPEKDRQVVELKFFAEMSNQEIAEMLGLSSNNVGVILFRALKKCQLQLK